MFGESLEMLSVIHYGENKSWEIAHRMDLPIHRFRTIVEKLLRLQFICYDQHDYSYSLTSRGKNVIKFAYAQIIAPA